MNLSRWKTANWRSVHRSCEKPGWSIFLSKLFFSVSPRQRMLRFHYQYHVVWANCTSWELSIPPRLFKFSHCFSRQIGLIKTLNGAETMGIYKSFSWWAWGFSLLGICFFPKQCSTVEFQLRYCEVVRKRRWNLTNACTYNRLCVDSSVYSAWVNTDSDPVENEEGLIIKIRPDNSFEMTVIQRS